MQKRLIFDQDILQVTIHRLCEELIENHGTFDESVMLGMQPRGVFLAERLAETLQSKLNRTIPVGYLDATFYRDDFRRRDQPIKANATKVPFLVEDKRVVLVDDVLFTGRSIRAALDAMIAFGRPRQVELLILVDRKYSRDLPIQPDYVGRMVNTLKSQRVLVEWREQGASQDSIWLVNNK